MSENIAIVVGGRARNFTADKLRVQQQDSEALALLVPESSVPLDSLDADVNATYVAADQGLYGYDVIEVNVPGYASGGGTIIQPDDDGDLIEETLPHHIGIGVLPSKLDYKDGETIVISSNMQVFAFNEDGTLWKNASYPIGRIPNRELSIDPTVADIESAETIYVGGGINALKLNVNIPMYGGPSYVYYRGSPIGRWSTGYPCSICSTHGPEVLLLTKYNGHFYGACIEGYNAMNAAAYDPTYPYGDGWHLVGGTPASAGYHMFNYGAFEEYMTDVPTSESDPNHKSTDDLEAKEGIQSITVTWPRYGDNKALTTTFEINVAAGFSGGSGNF